jgi:hypothetical protein
VSQGAQPSFTRPSFTRQQPGQSSASRFESFNRWSSARARAQYERDSEAPVSTGEHHEAVNPGTPHMTQQPIVHEGGGAPSSSGWGHAAPSGGGGFARPSGGGFGHPGGGSSSSTYHPSYSAPRGSFSAPARPSGGGGGRRR